MKELENKIRKALPRLQEVTKGCLFIDELGFDYEIVFVDSYIHYYSQSDNEVFSSSYSFFGENVKK